MKDETVADRARLAGLVVTRGLLGVALALRRPVWSLATRRSRVPARLLIAPRDIRTADPTVAADIYSGYFAFDGKAINTRGGSPFDLPAPSEAWAASLEGFGWLRHLRAANTALARVNARALVGDWIAAIRSARATGRRPEVVARRALSWLSHSPLILDGADAAFYRRFMRSLARHADALLASVERGPGGPGRLIVLVALCEIALCADGFARLQRRASRLLGDEVGRQILPDGGHIGRNPGVLLDLLLDLLPLRQAYAARSVQPPQQLLTAIDRMMPMVRCLRHGDGSLALFNGMGTTRPDLLATVLAYDDVYGAALSNARYSGYQRLDAGAATLIVDAGPPPPPVFAGDAHAGTLAFEFSAGPQRLVVNCGASVAPQVARDASRVVWDASRAARDASRATAAHSTLVLADRSSGRFATAGPMRGLLFAGPGVVTAERSDDPTGATLALSHDGYARRFGLIHARRLWLAPGGERLAGEDRLVPADGRRDAPPRQPFAIRFHLHPGLHAMAARDGAAVLIVCPGGERWSFEAGGLPVSLEESIFFAQAEGPRRTDQIVVRGETPDLDAVAWSFERQTAGEGA